MSSKNNTVDRKHILDSLLRTMRNRIHSYSTRNGVSPADVWPIYTIPIYLFESGCSGDSGRDGRLPRGNPSSANARASARDYKANVKQRSARLAGQSHGPLVFSVFLDHVQNERRGISLFFLLCDVHRERSTPFFLFYRPADMLPRGVTDRFVPKSGNILADFTRYL